MEEDERESSAHRLLPHNGRTRAAFISCHTSNQQILYLQSPTNNAGSDATLHHTLDDCHLWVEQHHWDINKHKGDSDCCLVRNERLRLVLSVRELQPN